MTNILNSLIIQENNIIGAKKLTSKKNSKYVSAPQYMPRYSLEKAM